MTDLNDYLQRFSVVLEGGQDLNKWNDELYKICKHRLPGDNDKIIGNNSDEHSKLIEDEVFQKITISLAWMRRDNKELATQSYNKALALFSKLNGASIYAGSYPVR